MLVVSLLTRGSPTQVTGGHLYHRRMAEAAGARDARDRLHLRPVCAIRCRRCARRRARRQHRGMGGRAVGPARRRRRDRSPRSSTSHPAASGKVRSARRLQRPLDQLLYRRCDLLIAASAALAHDARRPIRPAPPSGSASSNPAATCRSTATPAGDLRAGRRIALLCVGNWLPNKGVLELLEAVATLPPDHAHAPPGRSDRRRRGATPHGVQARLAGPDLAGRVVVHGAVTRRGGRRAVRRCRRVRPAELRRDVRHGVRRSAARPGSRPSDGARATCPTSSRTDARDASSNPATSPA